MKEVKYLESNKRYHTFKVMFLPNVICSNISNFKKFIFRFFFFFLKTSFNAILQHHFSLKMENYHLDDFCGKPCLYNRFVVLYQTKMTSSHWMKESHGCCLQTFLDSQKDNKDRSMVSNIIWCKAPFGLFPSLSFPHAMVC